MSNVPFLVVVTSCRAVAAALGFVVIAKRGLTVPATDNVHELAELQALQYRDHTTRTPPPFFSLASFLAVPEPFRLLSVRKMSEKPASEKPKGGTGSGAESPTTARPLDFDDDNETPTIPPETMASPPPPSKSPKLGVRFSEDATEIPPPKPPRPMSPQQQAENTLIEAFPAIDAKVVKAVLVASGGKVEPAFNALLSMSDPNFKAEETPPLQPPRTSQPRSQVEQDEIYARQLAEHYQSSYAQGYGSRGRGDPPLPRQRREMGLKPNELHEDKEHSFFDDDLPIIRKNIEQGFRETQTKVNKWITDFRKKLDGDDEDEFGQGQSSQQRQNFGPSQSDQLYGIRKSVESRRSADRERYDTDNRVLGDDFEALELRDDEGPTQTRSNRPLANPDLFKPTPVSPPQSGPVDEVDALYRNPSPANQPGKTGGKKWQPLTSVAPHPEPDEHDPFSLGDSDDDEAKAKDIKPEDTERLKKTASENKVESTGDLKPAERSGSIGQKDAAAEALLKDTK
ncbi:hypothetical protein CC78DRAFT_575665 [Lojkania enalia]|uniref:CUE domain-containing protein n=1 Tax=Lojkania enalia TaxID=147567 RepID=A0A9P4KJQ8_9PLEO|nr:hypothetical protein CC78DRAFT_575665 [Didymosphaeria enalia]